MAKKKLFTEDDFNKDSKTPKKSHMKWIIIAVIVIMAIIAIILCLKDCNSDNQFIRTEINSTSIPVIQDSVAELEAIEEIDSLDNENFQAKESYDEQLIATPITSKELPDKSAEPITNTEIVSDVETEALKVIRGDYGNNPQRIKNLGSNYQSIQNRVNELKRHGVF